MRRCGCSSSWNGRCCLSRHDGICSPLSIWPRPREATWRWVSSGAVAADTLWITASVAFTIYVANFNSYDKTYGSLGGVVILLAWLYLSAFVALFGAVINAQSEKQTRKSRPRGRPNRWVKRGARAADTLGPTRG